MPADLPGFLDLTDPLEPEQIPLQVALLTAEVAMLRRAMAQAAVALLPPPPALPEDFGFDFAGDHGGG